MKTNKSITKLAIMIIIGTLLCMVLLSACSPKKNDLDDNLSSNSDTTTTTTEAETSIVEVTDVNGETVTDVNGEAVTQIVEVVTKTEVVTNTNGEKVTDTNGVAVTEKVTQTKPYVKPTTTTTKANSGNVTPPTAPPKPATTTKPVVTVPPTKPPTTNVPTTEKRVTASNVGEMRKELQAYAESLGMIWEPWLTSETGSWANPIKTDWRSYDVVMELLKRTIDHQKTKNKKYVHISIEPNGEHYLAYTLSANGSN